MTHWLGTPGVVCAAGSGIPAIRRALLAGSTHGMIEQAGWVENRVLMLGACTDALPALPDSLARHHDSRNNRLLLLAARQIEAALRSAIDRYGADRVAVVIGTSTSGVNDNARAFEHLDAQGCWPDDYDYRRQVLSAPASFVSAWMGARGPAYTVSTACTSSARALLSARDLLDMDLCDAVVCGGADTLCRMTINGFASLEAISGGLCSPFSVNRNGINIGEAAVLFLMERTPGTGPAVRLLGGGASSDAWHMSSPDPEGMGARQAMRHALDDAGLDADDISWVNLHGTGTEHNDAMESHAMAAVFKHGIPCASTKPLTGHALGAAGALEAALAWMTLTDPGSGNTMPPHVWDGCPDPALPALDFSTTAHRFSAHTPRIIMSNSFAFGGNNASLILGGAL
ncbi:MAG TPA: beta-ketoacyl-ACP synthase [Candidimonas sp.]|nr:beta-ketoacyl-ACP synthase [Candidimonas sp.]